MTDTSLMLVSSAKASAIAFGIRLMPTLLVWFLPFAAYAAFSPVVPRVRRFVIPVGWLCLAYCGHLLGVSTAQLLTNLTGLLYFALVALLALPAASLVRAQKTSRMGLFVIGLVLCLLVPSTLLPGVAGAPVLALGWEMTFSFYSLCVEVVDDRGSAAPLPRWSDALFFLVVDPVLVFSERSRSGPTSFYVALARCGRGLGFIALSALLASPFAYALPIKASAPWLFAPPVVATGLIRFLIAYWGQMGLINVRIGLMHAAGYHSPECFANPLAASDPLDFWKRWNIYLGTWIKRYVFVPLVSRVGRSPWLKRGCVFAAFLACGVLHDTLGSSRRLELNLNFTLQFALVGAATLLWFAIDACLAVALERADSKPFGRLTRRIVARLTIVLAMLLLPFVWGNLS